MAKLELVKGTTSKLVQVFIQDSSSTTGAGLTGLAFNTAGLIAYYYREGAGSAVAISLATMTLGTWATGGFVVVDGTHMPGVYQLGIPNAALASGANSVVVMLSGASNMAPVLLEIELTATDNQNAAQLLTVDWTTILSAPAFCLLQAARSLRNEVTISGGVQTVFDEVGSPAYTLNLTTNAGALPIVSQTP